MIRSKTPKQAEVLLVEDDRSEALVFERLLAGNAAVSFAVTHAKAAREAASHLACKRFDVVLLDLFLPDSQGLDTVCSITAHAPDVPIVVLTSLADESLALRAVQEGAQDYLVKSNVVDCEGLGRSLCYAMERHRVKSRLTRLARYDALTGLPNRSVVLDRLEHALARAARRSVRLAVLFVDLDGFRDINERLGQYGGDQLLVLAAERLAGSLRSEDTLARVGGDEFAVVCEELRQEDDAVQVAERMVDSFKAPFCLNGEQLFITASVGIALGGAEATPTRLLQEADAAMFSAKGKGGGRFEVFDQRVRARALARLDTEQSLRLAMQGDEFQLHYQPIVELSTGTVKGLEALVRWNHPQRGLLPPGDFIPVAERTGMILGLGSWVVREACRQMQEWSSRRHGPPLEISVNLSACQLGDPNLSAVIEGALNESDLPAKQLCLEITESAVMEDLDTTDIALRALAEVGVKVEVDDFGTGYSSLVYLKRFPIRVLKIDRSFVQGVTRNIEDKAIVSAVINLAHTLGQEAVAEGVESGAQLAVLEEMGCDFAQGYHLGPPRPAAMLEDIVVPCV